MRKNFFIIVVVIMFYFFIALPSGSSLVVHNFHEADHVTGRTIRITCEQGKLVTLTARDVSVGDEVITAAGKHYRVTSVKGTEAVAKLLGDDKEYLSWVTYFENSPVVAVSSDQWHDRPVGIYHTHSDESYIPDDGDDSIPFEGGIYDVGDEFTEELAERGVNIAYYKTPHDPHDANAYERSRRTAMGIIKKNPIAVFDIHRDGIEDPEFYTEEVAGEEIAQIKIVVGRQNPKMEANMDFARRLMAYINKEYPGLVMEIFKADGNYNQDLLSTAVLLEAGTYTNSKEDAIKGMQFLANTMPAILGIEGPAPPEAVTAAEAGRPGWLVALGLLFATLAAGAAFAVINFGWQGSIDRLREFSRSIFGGEFMSFIQQVGVRIVEFVEGPLATGLRRLWDKLQEQFNRIGNRNH